MQRMISKRISRVAALFVVALAGSMGAGIWSVAAAGQTRWGADFFPNVTFTTHEGKSVRFYDDLIKGKIVAIDLIYTTCQYACPLETARLAQVQRLLGDRMGRDVFFYSITIDPEHDTPAVLDEYAKKYRAGPGWLFLTGSKRDIELVSRKLGLYSEPDPSNRDGHVPYLLVGNQATGQWMRNSAIDNPKFLARTIGDWLNSWQSRRSEPLKSYAEAPRLDLDRGQYTFAYHCSACHTVGRGDRIGPDLYGVTARRDPGWLRRFITAPDRMNAERDPIAVALRATYNQARMPNLELPDEDVLAVIDYLNQESRADRKSAPEAPVSASAAAGNTRSTELSAIVAAYIRIQQALYVDSIEAIDLNSRAIEAEAVKLGSAAESIRSAARDFERDADVKAARTTFAALSDAIVAYAKSSGASLGEGVVVAYCPMAQKHWLQKGTTVQNPFYGKEMPDCGRLVRESK